MHNKIVSYNLHTNGTELETASGMAYNGYYHINSNGIIMSGNTFDPSTSVQLYPINFMPITANNELLSEYNDTDGYKGVYSLFSIKNYKNDIDIQSPASNADAPRIILHPDQFFRRSNSISFLPGTETFIDESRTITVISGSIVTLDFTYISNDDDNIKFEWRDSYDRIVSYEKPFEIDTNDVDWIEETFSCTITDINGTDITNEVTVSIIDLYDHPIIFSNILKNGSANDDTSDWNTIGDTPEGVGKFLVDFEYSTNPNGLVSLGQSPPNVLGSIHYHKFGIDNFSVNQWYPRPEAIDFINGFSLLDEIKENYFRADQFLPVLPDQDNHSGTTKSSYQIIDLSEYSNILDGKVKGIKGVSAVLFGWLGGRADQGDKCSVTLEFLDDNDNIIKPPAGVNTTINSLSVYDRIINEVRITAPSGVIDITPYQAGYSDEEFGFIYTGSFNDKNDAIELPKIQALNEIISGTSINEVSTINGLCKTQIVGKMSDMIPVPKEAKKIKITKYYTYIPGRFDLIRNAKEWEEVGLEYISDAMVVGLNVRLYPIIIDNDGNEINTGIDESGAPIIKGFNMETFPILDASINYVPDLSLELESIEWLNPDTAMTGTQLFTGRATNTQKSMFAGHALIPNAHPILALGTGYSIIPDNIMLNMYKDVILPKATVLHDALDLYVNDKFNIAGYGLTTLLVADQLNLLNYSAGDGLLADFSDDNIFQ